MIQMKTALSLFIYSFIREVQYDSNDNTALSLFILFLLEGLFKAIIIILKVKVDMCQLELLVIQCIPIEKIYLKCPLIYSLTI